MTAPHPGTAPSAPLADVTVIELSAYVATPLAGLTMAQLGADVIRVEPLGGQADRRRMPVSDDGTSLYWAGLNKGKRAIEVDLRQEAGRALVRDLVAASGPRGGIVVTNTAGLAGLTEPELRAVRPDLIHALLTGHRDGSTGVDYTVQASVGLHAQTGPRDATGPVNDVFPFWDLACGLHLATGLLAAERHRLLTGEGQQITLALHDVAMNALGTLGWLTEAQTSPVPRDRAGNDVYGMFGRDFTTSEGRRLMLVVISARHWRQLVELTGIAAATDALEQALDCDFTDENARYVHRAALGGLIEPWFAARTFAEATEALSRTSILTAPFRTFAELAADDGAALAGDPLFTRIDHPGIGPHWAPGAPVVLDNHQVPAALSPRVGQHTDEVLGSSLGLDSRALADLRARGVLGSGS